MEFRKIFDTVPEAFDRLRPRYCKEAFDDMILYSGLNPTKSALEIGPGTGQATEPVLKTGCGYTAIELGERLAAKMTEHFSVYPNFKIIVDDFETHDFGDRRFDLVYSAAAMQWIPEEIGFSKSYALLKEGGTFAMLRMAGDYKTPNERLYREIQKVYDAYFHPEIPYTQKNRYENAVNYGFRDFETREYRSRREFNADQYIAYLGTHCDHLVLKEPDRSRFFENVRNAILNDCGKVVFYDTIYLSLMKK